MSDLNKKLQRNILLLGSIWSLIFIISLWRDIRENQEQINALAVNEVESDFNDIDTFRHWIASQGGIYVPVSDQIKPNPALAHITERDVITPSNKQLTLVNTPYLLRQLTINYPSSFNAHMSSLNPLNPFNQANEWESYNLKKFINNPQIKEAMEIVTRNNQPYLSLIKPARYESGCGDCHTDKSLKNGDVLGGLIVSVPMNPYYELSEKRINILSLSHGIIWMIGILGLASIYRIEKKHEGKRKEAEDYLRTSSIVFQNLDEGVIITDAELNIITCNDALCKISGFTYDEIMQTNNIVLKPEYFEIDNFSDFENYLSDPDKKTREFLLEQKSGTLIQMKLTVTEVRNNKNILTNYIFLYSDISKAKQLEDKLVHMAQHDHLTGLPNRALLIDRLEHSMNRAARANKKLSVLFLDLDNFKTINDSSGHEVGDKILAESAQRLIDRLRKEDSLARYGGDEFVVVMDEITTNDDPVKLADSLIKCMHPPFRFEEHDFKIGISIGICIFPDHAKTITELLNNADKAMYQAKAHGGDNYKIYDCAASSMT